MKTMTTVRARCIYSKIPRFSNSSVYEFVLTWPGVSYDTYVSIEGGYAATRLLGDCSRALVTEGEDIGVIAVFEVC